MHIKSRFLVLVIITVVICLQLGQNIQRASSLSYGGEDWNVDHLSFIPPLSVVAGTTDGNANDFGVVPKTTGGYYLGCGPTRLLAVAFKTRRTLGPNGALPYFVQVIVADTPTEVDAPAPNPTNYFEATTTGTGNASQVDRALNTFIDFSKNSTDPKIIAGYKNGSMTQKSPDLHNYLDLQTIRGVAPFCTQSEEVYSFICNPSPLNPHNVAITLLASCKNIADDCSVSCSSILPINPPSAANRVGGSQPSGRLAFKNMMNPNQPYGN